MYGEGLGWANVEKRAPDSEHVNMLPTCPWTHVPLQTLLLNKVFLSSLAPNRHQSGCHVKA